MKWYLKVLKQYTDFNGRARRKEYWMFVLFNLIFSMVWGFICGFAGFPEMAQLYTLAIIIPTIAVGVRRMHDVGKSGWFILIPVYSFILAVSKGDEVENKCSRCRHRVEAQAQQNAAFEHHHHTDGPGDYQMKGF